jgi:hypothetical protein
LTSRKKGRCHASKEKEAKQKNSLCRGGGVKMATQAIPPPPKKKQEDLVKTAISHMTVEEGAGHMTSVDSGAKTPCIRKFLNG